MGWYYPPPQPTQAIHDLVQPTTGSSPLPRIGAATMALIASIWSSSYDPSPYVRRAAQVAPLIPVVSQKQPSVGVASLYTVRSAWADPGAAWAVQSEPDGAPLVSLTYGQQPPPELQLGAAAIWQWSPITWPAQVLTSVAAVTAPNNPSFALRVPVTAADPQRPFCGVAWQYGFVSLGGAANNPPVPPLVNNPPNYTFAGFYCIRATWAQDSWPAQTYPPSANTPNGPIVQPYVPVGPLGLVSAINSWPQPIWPAQDLVGPVVQPYPGDEPPGTYNSPELQAYGYYDPWPAQRVVGAAALIPPPIVSPYLPPTDFYYPQLVAWQLAPAWSAQSQTNGAPFVSLVYGQQPPPYSIAQVVADRATWIDVTWGEQSEAAVAGIVPPPVVSQPVPQSTAAFNALRASWAYATWSAQRPYSPIAPLTLIYGQAPPAYSIAALVGLRSTWVDATWVAQAPSPSAALVPPPVVNAPSPSSYASLLAIESLWAPANWQTQRAALFTASAPSAQVPRGLPNLSAILAWTAGATWPAQFSPANAGWNVPRVDAPQPSSFVSLYTLRLLWADATWPTQIAWARGSIDTVPPIIYTFRAPERLNLDDYGKRLNLDDYSKRLTLDGYGKRLVE